MQYSSPSLLILFILTMLISVMYFFVFLRNQEKYISYWTLSWFTYSVSLLFIIFFLKNTDMTILLAIRKVLDLFNIVFLLFGIYSFMNIRVPNHWMKYSLYQVIWCVIAIVYGFDITLILFPISIYQAVLSVVLCYILWKNWPIDRLEKIFTIAIFSLWGISKIYFPYYQAYHFDSSTFFYEIILANILNFCILLIYLQKIKSELDIRNSQFKLLAENATDIIFYFKLQPYPSFSYISPSVKKITGYSPDDFYKNPKLHIEITHPKDRSKSQSLFSEKNSNISTVLRWQCIDGNYIWVEFRNSAIIQHSICTGIEGIIRDITQRKEAEESLIQSRKARQLLLSYISHELKTPVTSILGYISAVKDGTFSDSASRKNAIDVIFSKVLTLQHLIEDLLQLTKLETKQFSFQFMQVNVSNFINYLVNKHAWDIKNAGLDLKVHIHYEIEKNAFDILIDKERIEQVFTNLVFNAINYTPSGGTITIICRKAKVQEKIIISIKDTGAGISKEDLPHIFDRFFKGTTNKKMRGKGSGLGLTISKEILNAHHGEIWIESTLGKGSLFNFSLPIYKE